MTVSSSSAVPLAVVSVPTSSPKPEDPQFDIAWIEDTTLGWILLVVGILAIILALVVNQQRRSKVVERREEPPRY